MLWKCLSPYSTTANGKLVGLEYTDGAQVTEKANAAIIGLGPRDGKLVLINTEWNPGKLAVKDMDEIRRRFQTLL